MSVLDSRVAVRKVHFATPEVSESLAHGKQSDIAENATGDLDQEHVPACDDGSNPGSGAPALSSFLAATPSPHGSSLAPRADPPSPGSRRGSPRWMDETRGQAAHCGNCGKQSVPCRSAQWEDGPRGLDVPSQQGEPEEERAEDLLREGPESDDRRLGHHRRDAAQGDEQDHGDLRTTGDRLCRLRQAVHEDVLGGLPLRSELLRVGEDDLQGRGLLPASGPVRPLARHPRGDQDRSPAGACATPKVSGLQGSGQDRGGDPGAQCLEFLGGTLGSGGGAEPPLADPCRAPSQGDVQQGLGGDAPGDLLSPGEDVPDDGEPACELDARHQLSSMAASALAYKSQGIIPKAFNECLGRDRPRLMEVACSPNSVLSSTFQAKLGNEESAIRCSVWNGADLSKPLGLQLVLEQIRCLNPLHVWLSPPCGPYSPMQHTNQRTPDQKHELYLKRQEAIKIYHSVREIT